MSLRLLAMGQHGDQVSLWARRLAARAFHRPMKYCKAFDQLGFALFLRRPAGSRGFCRPWPHRTSGSACGGPRTGNRTGSPASWSSVRSTPGRPSRTAHPAGRPSSTAAVRARIRGSKVLGACGPNRRLNGLALHVMARRVHGDEQLERQVLVQIGQYDRRLGRKIDVIGVDGHDVVIAGDRPVGAKGALCDTSARALPRACGPAASPKPHVAPPDLDVGQVDIRQVDVGSPAGSARRGLGDRDAVWKARHRQMQPQSVPRSRPSGCLLSIPFERRYQIGVGCLDQPGRVPSGDHFSARTARRHGAWRPPGQRRRRWPAASTTAAATVTRWTLAISPLWAANTPAQHERWRSGRRCARRRC